MTSSEFLYGVLDLFSDTLSAILQQPVLRFIACVLPVLAFFALAGSIVRGVKRM